MKFYDTSSLLETENISDIGNIVISSVTIEELENIKVSANKDQDIKNKARNVVRWLKNNSDKYNVIIHTKVHDDLISALGIPINNDAVIIACAYGLKQDKLIFYTEDILCELIAKDIFGLNVSRISNGNREHYTGYKTIEDFTDEQISRAYSKDNTVNIFDCLTNQYVILKREHEIVDILRWTGEHYANLTSKNIKSLSFGDKIKPKDEYQRIAIDSLLNNTITAISGHAGSGKSLLCLMTAMHLIDSGKYDRLVILFNPCPVRGSTQMGFYAGDMVEKAMQSNIGHILVTKIGERFAVDSMVKSEKIKLIPMADCRGTEVRDNEILWITEAENTTVDLMKLCLTRVSSGAKVFVEGDYDQIDSKVFENKSNGLKRAIEILRGNPEFGFVELQNVWRSRIAELADKM